MAATYDSWYFKYHEIYFEDTETSLSKNQYLIFSTKVNLYNYQVQAVLSDILAHSNIPATPEPPQEIEFQQLNQNYIAELRQQLGSFKNRQKYDDLEIWLRVNNLLAILSNHSTVTIPSHALLTFAQGKKFNNKPEVSANDTFLTRLVSKRNHK